MKKERTRRETLITLGAAGITILVGCGDDSGTGAGGAGGGAGEGGAGRGGGSSGSGGSSGAGGAGKGGTAGAGGGGSGGTGGGSAGAGGGGSGGTGGGSAGAGGGTAGAGGGGTAGARPDGGAGTAGAGGTGGGGASGAGGAAGTGTGGAGTAGTGGGAGAGGTGPDGSAGMDAGRDGSGNPTDSASGDSGAVQCQAKQETTVGPYPNINPLNRRDVRGNTTGTTTPKEGVELTLRMRVLDLDNGCAPISGAVVDIWQCDAVGVYAGYSTFGTTGQDFCRGYQITDAQGMVEFVTIFPGSYTGRAIHIHFSIQGSPSNLSPNAEGSSLPTVAVAQLYFLRAVADDVWNMMPIYKMGAAITPNESDGIYGGGGKDLLVNMTKNGTVYVGEVVVGMHRGAIGK